MVMSKLGKKVMSAIIAVAMVLPGVCCMQATVSAAENDPTVKMLGATISTDNDTGYQSIRAGIEVSNASNAGACGIKIKLKNGEGDYKIVSTEDEKYQKIYSKDTEADKVVYTVIVNKIPVAQAATEIEFVGFVKKLNDETGTEIKTESITKSVNGVVESIGDSIGKDVKILESGDYAGTLVYEYAKLDMTEAKNNLQDENADAYTAGHFIIGRDDARATSEYVKDAEDGPYYKITTSGASEDEGKIGKGIGYIHEGVSESDVYIYSADLKIDADKYVSLLTRSNFNSYNGAGNNNIGAKEIKGTGDWQKFEEKVTKIPSWDNALYISAINSPGAIYCIKNLVIYKPVSEADIPEITAPPTGWNEDKTEYSLKLDNTSVVRGNPWTDVPELKFNSDGSVQVLNETEFGIILPEEIYKDNKFDEIKITYSKSKNTDSGFVMLYETSNPQHVDDEEGHWNAIFKDPSGAGTDTITPNNKDKNISGIRVFSSKGVIIKSVVFVKAKQ